jgi:hypothetical protein
MNATRPDELLEFFLGETHITEVLRYFQLFSWPLTETEIIQFYAGQEAPSVIQKVLALLVRNGKVQQAGTFYQLEECSHLVDRRLDYEARAQELWPVARRMAEIIAGFPFVRAVLVSGSLSKNAMGPESDIDFFIITEPRRLWVARTLLVLFKRVFLFNSHRYFCVNYFIDTEHLFIAEHNRFTATEIVTLHPLYGRTWHKKFYAANSWAWEMFPHFPHLDLPEIPEERDGFLKRQLEKWLSGPIGDWLDRQWMHLSLRFWRRKFRHFSSEAFDRAVRCSRHEAKLHPMQYQHRVLEALHTN